MSTNINSEHFDIWLFAVDLVNFVFLKSYKRHLLSVTGRYPQFVCKGFNKTIKKAVELIKDFIKQDVDADFVKLQQGNYLTPETYTNYAKEVSKVTFLGGFEAEKFLYYCVHVAFMAYRFRSGGVRKAQISAVYIIANDFQDYKLNYDLWDALNTIAEKIACDTPRAGNLPLCNSLPSESSMGVDSFESPEYMHKQEGIKWKTKYEDLNEDSTNVSIIDTTMKDLLYSQDLLESKLHESKVLSNSCRLSESGRKEYSIKEYKSVIFSVESLESSLEQLSLSSTAFLKFIDDRGNSNWSPNLCAKRSPGMIKNRTLRKSGLSLERKILKLSPLGRNKC